MYFIYHWLKKKKTFWEQTFWHSRHFGIVCISGIDILGVDILGVDISALPHLPYVDKYVICRQDRLSVSTREEESPVFFLFRFPRAHETESKESPFSFFSISFG